MQKLNELRLVSNFDAVMDIPNSSSKNVTINGPTVYVYSNGDRCRYVFLQYTYIAVSYTHLTLPTKRIV